MLFVKGMEAQLVAFDDDDYPRSKHKHEAQCLHSDKSGTTTDSDENPREGQALGIEDKGETSTVDRPRRGRKRKRAAWIRGPRSLQTRAKNKDKFIAKAKAIHGDDAYEYIGEYVRSDVPMLIRHKACGREFEQRPDNHAQGKGCSACFGGVKSNKEDFVTKANAKHGSGTYTYLGEYIRATERMLMRHEACGHEFEQLVSVHLRGSGCPRCFGGCIGWTKDEFVEKARAIQGSGAYEYLGEYVNANTPMLMRHAVCAYEFTQTPSNHLRESGCPKCAGNLPLSKEEFVARAIAKHGAGQFEYLGEYTNMSTPTMIRHTVCGHEFPQRPCVHLRGSGCPSCWLKSEHASRQILEHLLAPSKFPKARPKWLQGLELDGRCKNLKLAFEYQGLQHYQQVDIFHKDEQDFKAQQERDARKRSLLARRGYALLEIPYQYHSRDLPKLESFIRGWLEDHGYIRAEPKLC